MEEVIKASSEVLLVSADEQTDLTLIDPKTRGVLETYTDDAGAGSWIARNTLTAAPKLGQILGFQSSKTILSVWSFGSKKVQMRISCNDKLTSTAISNSELYFAAGSASGFVYLWDTLSGQLLKKHKAHSSSVRCIQFSYDDGLLITAADDALVHVFLVSSLLAPDAQMKLDLNNGKTETRPRHTLIGHSEKINAIVQSKGVLGKLYTASSDNTVIVWDLCKGCKLGQLTVESEITCLELDGEEEYIFSGCRNGNIYKTKVNDNIGYKLDVDEITETPTLERSRLSRNVAFKGHTNEVTHVQLYQEQKQLISGGRDGQIIFWDFDGSVVKTMNIFNKPIANMCIFKRPREFDQKSALVVAKRAVQFKPFHRYEETEADHRNSIKEHKFIMPAIPPKKNKHIAKQTKELTKKSFLQATRFLLRPNNTAAEQGETGSSSSSASSAAINLTQDQIQELIAENLKLKQLNHALFNKNIAPSTS